MLHGRWAGLRITALSPISQVPLGMSLNGSDPQFFSYIKNNDGNKVLRIIPDTYMHLMIGSSLYFVLYLSLEV